MAIEKTYLLGKNITLGCGFDLQAKAPLDSRQTVPEYAGLQALIDGNAAYEGMIVYDEETKKTYQAQLVDGALAFREFGINEAELKALIASETTAAMEFKGAAAALPENPAKGDMYKVTAAFKVGEEDVKIGDSIVYDGEQWFVIPSGDDIEDTWRPVTDVDNDATLTFAAGDKLDVAVASNGTVTYSHEAIDAPVDMTSEDDEHTRTYITQLIADNHGHIIGFKTATENVEDTNTTYEFEGQSADTTSVYFQVKSSEADAAEVIYLNAYSKNESDAEFAKKLDKSVYEAYIVGKEMSDEDLKKHAEDYADSLAGNYDAAGAAESVKTELSAEIAKKVDAVEGKSLVDDAEIVKLADVSAGANKVEASETNGNIKIDGVETVVYTHPEKHAIADITGLQDALDGMQSAGDYAAEEHTHTRDEITDFAHTHIASEITDLDATIKGYDYATKAEAQAMADGKDAAIEAAQAAADNAQGEIDALETYVGTFNHATAKTVVEYINAKTDGIATSGNLEALAGRVGALEAIDHDAYVAADTALKTELTTEIGKKADSTALAAAVEALEGADADLAEAIEAAKSEASSQDAVVLAEAQAYAVSVAESKVNALSGNVYTKEQTYTQKEVDALLAAAQSWGEF